MGRFLDLLILLHFIPPLFVIFWFFFIAVSTRKIACFYEQGIAWY